MDMQVQFNFNLIALVLANIRSRAYLPSFNVIPAKIIDPTVGASTWALGNHKCTRNIGILTKKAVIKLKYTIVSIIINLSDHLIINNFLKKIKTIKSGKDPNRV